MRGLEDESVATTTISESTETMTTSCSTESAPTRSCYEDSATVSEMASDERVRVKEEQLVEKKKPEISGT